MQFVAVTDTSGNLPTPLVKEHDLKMIPFAYFIDGERFTCLDRVAHGKLGALIRVGIARGDHVQAQDPLA